MAELKTLSAFFWIFLSVREAPSATQQKVGTEQTNREQEGALMTGRTAMTAEEAAEPSMEK